MTHCPAQLRSGKININDTAAHGYFRLSPGFTIIIGIKNMALMTRGKMPLIKLLDAVYQGCRS